MLHPQLRRLRADVLCLQKVHAQEPGDDSRQLEALTRLLEARGTPPTTGSIPRPKTGSPTGGAIS